MLAGDRSGPLFNPTSGEVMVKLVLLLKALGFLCFDIAQIIALMTTPPPF
jgi:hypothetical protein